MTHTPRTDRYSALSIAIHWIAAILVVALFLTHEGGRGSAAYTFHVSGGAVAGLFLLWRAWYRIRRGMADKPDQAAIFTLASRIVLWGFLASIVAVTVSGYLLDWSRGQPLEIFDLLSIPSPMAASTGIHEFLKGVHKVSGQLFPFLLILHVAGTAKHAIFDRDGIVSRMFSPTAGGR